MNPTISLQLEKDYKPQKQQGIVVFLFSNFDISDVPASFQKYFDALIDQKFKAESDSSSVFNDGMQQTTFIGCGDKKDFHISDIHEQLGNTLRAAGKKYAKVMVYADALLKNTSAEAALKEIILTAELSLYTFDKYKSEASKKENIEQKEVVILLTNIEEKFRKIQEETLILSEGIKFTRDICNEPPNVATPMYLAYHMKADTADTPYTIEIFDDKKIQEMGMNLVYAVGKGSTKPSYFIKLSYFGDATTKEFRALVGKGVAFDAGGNQVKPDFSMCTMKTDMSGAAAVMGTIHTIANLKLKTNVIGYIPFVQNMPDGNAFCPDDVYTAFNGKTVEIIHTDAEGRLILADALAYASLENPIEIIDLATLTGAAIVALGDEFGAIMGTGEDLKRELKEIGDTINEKLWPLPFHKAYKKHLKSNIADLANLPQTRMTPGTIIGGMFLKEFVDEKIPWVHLDIAGTTHVSADSGLKSGSSTGFGVRLLVEYLTSKQKA
ncbi:MAG: leucyl aminopeptidase family protein [Candidatus Gracilibacteria bacterium]